MLEIDDTWTSDPARVRVLQDASGAEVFPPQEMPPPRPKPQPVDTTPDPPPPAAPAAVPAEAAEAVAGGSVDEASLKKMRVVELKEVAKGLGLNGFSKLKKAELIALIVDSA